MGSVSSAGSKRQDLIDLAHEALDQYESLESDLGALVSDLDDIVDQLRPLSGKGLGAELRDIWHRLAAVYDETPSGRMSELGAVTVTAAVHEFRALLDR